VFSFFWTLSTVPMDSACLPRIAPLLDYLAGIWEFQAKGGGGSVGFAYGKPRLSPALLASRRRLVLRHLVLCVCTFARFRLLAPLTMGYRKVFLCCL
jgi:hypothetical protein